MQNGTRQQHQGNRRSDYPTSPWTEAYHAAPLERFEQSGTKPAMPKSAFESDDLRPTRDALTDIYNRGY